MKRLFTWISSGRAVAFLVRTFCFAIVFAVLFLKCESHFYDRGLIHSTWKYVASTNNAPIDILFVGNSHMFRTIDPELISRSMNLNARMLGEASLLSEVFYADLKAFLMYNKPRVIVLELCPFVTEGNKNVRSSRIGLVYKHLDGVPDLWTKFCAFAQCLDVENVLPGTFQLLRGTEMWKRWGRHSVRATQNEYGSPRPTYTSIEQTGFDIEEIERMWLATKATGCGMNPLGKRVLEKVLNLADAAGVDVWVLNAPTLCASKDYAGAVNEVEMMRKDYSSLKYMDDAMPEMSKLNITSADFCDVNHLNISGMGKVTLWMMGLIKARFDRGIDTSECLIYKDSSMEKQPDGLFRYKIDVFATNALYQFRYVNNLGEMVQTGWKEENWVDDVCMLDLRKFQMFASCDSSHRDAKMLSVKRSAKYKANVLKEIYRQNSLNKAVDGMSVDSGKFFLSVSRPKDCTCSVYFLRAYDKYDNVLWKSGWRKDGAIQCDLSEFKGCPIWVQLHLRNVGTGDIRAAIVGKLIWDGRSQTYGVVR